MNSIVEQIYKMYLTRDESIEEIKFNIDNYFNDFIENYIEDERPFGSYYYEDAAESLIAEIYVLYSDDLRPDYFMDEVFGNVEFIEELIESNGCSNIVEQYRKILDSEELRNQIDTSRLKQILDDELENLIHEYINDFYGESYDGNEWLNLWSLWNFFCK